MENKKLKLSKWCHFFFFGEIVAIYHALSMNIVFMEEKKATLLKDMAKQDFDELFLSAAFNDSEIKELLDNGILINELILDDEQLNSLRTSLVEDTKLDLMYLLLTDNCNMKCLYCFEDSPEISCNFKPSMMSEETACKSMDYFSWVTNKYGRPGGKRVIHLYGGEPTLNIPALKAAVIRVSELKESNVLPEDTDVVLITNGLLMDDKLATFLAEYKVAVGLSIDGPENLNNKYRIAKQDGINVSVKSIQAYNTLISHGVTVGLSATLTPEVVNNFPEVLSYFINNLKIKDGMSFNILHFSPAVPVDSEYYEKAAECLIKAFESFRELNIYEERMMRKVKSFVNQEAMLADCGIVGNQIVIAPDGQIGVCQDFVKTRQYYYGSIYDKGYDPVKEGIFSKWRESSPLFKPECFSCEAVAICGGGCPASIELMAGDRNSIDVRICPHSKLTLKWLIYEALQSVM